MQQEGYQLFFANNADKANTIIHTNDIAVIIADNKMPGTSGLDFLSEAKHKSPYSVRLMLSGDCDQQCAIKSINLAQIYKFISKPFAGRELKETIKNAVKKFHESKLIADLSNNNLNLIQVIQQFALNKNSENIALVEAKELTPGMTLDKDLQSDSGVLIAKKGYILSFHDLKTIASYTISKKIAVK